MPIDDKYKGFGKSAYDILNNTDPYADLYSSPFDWKSLNTPTNKTDEKLKELREQQNLNDKVNKKMVKPYIQRVAKQMDNPRATNPQMLWNVKRQNHKLLKTTTNRNLREKLTQEILQADEQLIKNLDDETKWMTDEKQKIRNTLTESTNNNQRMLNEDKQKN